MEAGNRSSRLNLYLLLMPFNMDPSWSVMLAIRYGAFLITLDLKNATALQVFNQICAVVSTFLY